MFFCVFCRFFLEHLLTEHLRMTASCVYLWILRICLIQAKKNIKNKKYYSFRKCRWREISSPVRLHKFFFNRFSGDLLFFSFLLLFFLFFSCFWFLFEIKKYIFWYTFDYAGGWVIMKFSPDRFPETRLLFFGLTSSLEHQARN